MAEIELMVKTLDSSNHSFKVKDDMSVLDFKKVIEHRVGTEFNRQRLIYCGKVLADEKKLNEYDLNGKTVHLVLKNPNASNNPQSQQASTSGQQPPQQGVHGHPIYSGQWTIAWPPPILLRGASVAPGQAPPTTRSRSAAPSTTQASSASMPVHPVPHWHPGDPGQPRVVPSRQMMPASSTMTIPIGQWTLPSGPAGGWGPSGFFRQRTTSGPASSTPTNGQGLNGAHATAQVDIQMEAVPINGPVRMGPPPAPAQQPRPTAPINVNVPPAPVPIGTSATGNSYLLGAFQVPQDVFDPENLNNIVQDVMSQLGVLGRNATVMSRTSDDGSAVDVHINLGQIASNNEIRNRIAVIRRLLRGLNEGLAQLDQSLAALDGHGPPPPPLDIPGLVNNILGYAMAPQPNPNAPQPPQATPQSSSAAPQPSPVAPHQPMANHQATSFGTASVCRQGSVNPQPVRSQQPMRTEPVIVSNPTIVTAAAEPVPQQVTSQLMPAVPSTSSGALRVDNKENKTAATAQGSDQLKQSGDSNKVTSIPKEVSSPSEECDEFFDASGEEAMASSSSARGDVPETSETSLIGSESWHREVPSSWIPIISADLDLQRRNGGNVHEPLSEAYLNVLPKKKRKTGD